jgi:hypothetical protein
LPRFLLKIRSVREKKANRARAAALVLWRSSRHEYAASLSAMACSVFKVLLRTFLDIGHADMAQIYPKALVETYSELSEFRDKLARQLTLKSSHSLQQRAVMLNPHHLIRP